MNAKIRSLALGIGNCDNFHGVVSNNENNPCKTVVNWQSSRHSPADIEQHGLAAIIHRPEPWAGNLEAAPIMFLSSNPSFDSRELFPTLRWDDSETIDFFVNRFTFDASRKYGATEGPSKSDFDRAILKDGTRTSKVRTWHALRSRASVLLDQPLIETLASRHYVMTEVVHCKSQKEVGVTAALPTCVSKWFMPMLTLSSARLIVVSGTPAGIAVKQAVKEMTQGQVALGPKWGAWKNTPPANGTWPKSTAQLEQWKASGDWSIAHQRNHIESLDFELDGNVRSFTFMWMPHPVRSVPQKIDNSDLYHPEILDELRSLLSNPAK